ncbi:EpsG family protein [Pediococcus cellicola]|uniref:EpsG family protein n=1 Tax=Pediococcus cellicola TaxID=319652 RepID=A0A0R2IWK5_9LACO|nr:EpsG family protein [Pediococcus cellicola]KRN66061.1 hypothetical protein IV80_GL001621 [Pediococcus cellicola]GEL15468.1 hypothetical protein PCE01_12700 [Pediococcus cellicola]
MIFYVGTFFLISILTLIAQYFSPENLRQILLFLVFLILLFILGFRNYTVGSDTPTYVNLYNSIGTFPIHWSDFFSSRFEIGFLKYLSFLHLFSTNYVIMLFTSAFIFLFCWFWSIKKLSTNIFLSFAIFFGLRIFTFAMTNLRQTLAMGLVLVSYLLFVKGKKFLAVIMVIIATTFHISAIVFLLYYLISSVKLTVKVEIALAVVTVIALSLFQTITESFSQIFSRFESYTEAGMTQGTDKLSIVVNICILILIFIFMQVINYSYQKNDKSLQNFDFENSYNMIIFIGILFSIISLKFVMISRLVYYFSMFSVFSLPNALKKIKDKLLQSTLVIILFLFFMAYVLIIMWFRPEWNVIIPYSSSLFL